MKTILIVFCLTVICSGASSNPKALIYRGPGTCKGCPETVGAALESKGILVKYVGPREISNAVFENVDLYVQPGGVGDEDIQTLKALTAAQIMSLRKFVAKGGKYLGICAGAYLAGQYWDEEKNIRAFGLLPTTVYPEPVGTSAQLIDVNWRGRHRKMYFQYGAYFDYKAIPDSRVWAVYKKTNHAAALIAPFGRGHVGVIGPHPEANEYWFQLSHLVPVDGLSTDLFLSFVHSLLNAVRHD